MARRDELPLKSSRVPSYKVPSLAESQAKLVCGVIVLGEIIEDKVLSATVLSATEGFAHSPAPPTSMLPSDRSTHRLLDDRRGRRHQQACTLAVG